MNLPIITVVTVTYNCKSEIEETIKSVLSQTYKLVEYIIIDGKSTDGTLNIINKYSNQITRIISEPDRGIFDAMNKAIDLATGEWINFMNAGDRFYATDTLEKMINRAIPTSAGVIFGETYTIEGKQNLLPFIYNEKRYCGMGICHQSLLTRTDLAKKIKFQDREYKICADYNMIRTIYNQGYTFVDTKLPICYFDLNGVSIKNTFNRMKECAKICKAQYSLSFVFAYIHVRIQRLLQKQR